MKFCFKNPTWSQLLIPPSFVGLFNRRLTTNDFPTNQFIPQQTFQLNFNDDHHNHRQGPVSVITLSSDEDDEQQPPPRFFFFSFPYSFEKKSFSIELPHLILHRSMKILQDQISNEKELVSIIAHK